MCEKRLRSQRRLAVTAGGEEGILIVSQSEDCVRKKMKTRSVAGNSEKYPNRIRI